MPILDRAGVPLHYELVGDSGPPVLLVQGCGVAGEGWRPQVDALALLDHLGWASAHVGGHSLGGVVAQPIEGARYVEIEDAAHGVVIQKADVVNALLAAHITAAERAFTDRAATARAPTDRAPSEHPPPSGA